MWLEQKQATINGGSILSYYLTRKLTLALSKENITCNQFKKSYKKKQEKNWLAVFHRPLGCALDPAKGFILLSIFSADWHVYFQRIGPWPILS